METNLFNQAFERQVIENESNETLWQLAQKKLGGDGDAPFTTDAVLELSLNYRISLAWHFSIMRAYDNDQPVGGAAYADADAVRAILMCFLMMGKVNNE